MEFIDEIEEFLNIQKSENISSTLNTYRSKIFSFYEFVVLI